VGHDGRRQVRAERPSRRPFTRFIAEALATHFACDQVIVGLKQFRRPERALAVSFD